MLLVNTLRPLMNVFSNQTKEAGSIGVERAASGDLLVAVSRLDPLEACAKVGSALEGLSRVEADARLKKFGPNLVARERKATIPEELWSRARNPLNALLLTPRVRFIFLGRRPRGRCNYRDGRAGDYDRIHPGAPVK